MIEFTEFLSLMVEKKEPDFKETVLRAAFSSLDKDGKGFISANSLQLVITSLLSTNELTADLVDEMIREAGIDGDGQVSYEGKNLTIVMILVSYRSSSIDSFCTFFSCNRPLRTICIRNRIPSTLRQHKDAISAAPHRIES